MTGRSDRLCCQCPACAASPLPTHLLPLLPSLLLPQEFLPKELGPEASLELAALGGSAACIKVLLAAPDLYNGPATNYVLVAAAQGGSCEAVALIAEGLQPLRVRQVFHAGFMFYVSDARPRGQQPRIHSCSSTIVHPRRTNLGPPPTFPNLDLSLSRFCRRRWRQQAPRGRKRCCSSCWTIRLSAAGRWQLRRSTRARMAGRRRPCISFCAW